MSVTEAAGEPGGMDVLPKPPAPGGGGESVPPAHAVVLLVLVERQALWVA